MKGGDQIPVEFPSSKTILKLRVLTIDRALDYAVLLSEEQDAPGFLKPYSGDSEDLVGQNMVLCAFQIALDEDLPGELQSIGFMRATGSKVSRKGHHLVYESNAWCGDPGGALVLYDGEVAGMHQESINGIREFARQEEVLGGGSNERYQRLASSLQSVLQSISQGSLALLSHVFAT